MAIAFDSSALLNISNPGSSSATWSHTCTGSSLVLFVGVLMVRISTNSIPTATYNGVSMTQISNTVTVSPSGLGDMYMFYLANPATGSNNVVVSYLSTGILGVNGVSLSYTGASQTGIPDSSNSGNGSGTSFSVSTTVVASNCWVVAMLSDSSANIIATAPFVLRNGNGEVEIGDSNGTVSTGSYSSGATGTSGTWGGIAASFASVTGSFIPSMMII